MISKVGSISGEMNISSKEISLSDIKSKSLENRLTEQQQRLNKVSNDSEMAEAEKEKERKKIEQRIAEIKRELQMEQMKAQKEQKVEKEQESNIIHEEKPQKSEPENGLEKEKAEAQDKEEKVALKEVSPKEIYNIINVDSLMKQDRVMMSAERKEEAIENVLESEIKTDRLYGGDSTLKEEQLSAMRKEKRIRIDVPQAQEKTNIWGNNNGAKVVIRDN